MKANFEAEDGIRIRILTKRMKVHTRISPDLTPLQCSASVSELPTEREPVASVRGTRVFGEDLGTGRI